MQNNMQNVKSTNPAAQHTQAPRITFFRERTTGHRTQQVIAGILAAAMLPFTAGVAWSQEAPPPPPDTYNNGSQQSNYQPLPSEQLDQLVAPIALYPDSLVAQVLAASTYPQQVVAAEQFVQQSGNYPPSQLAEMANEQPWDPSVKSLVAFPQVLSDLNQNMNWTTQLGNAYYNQPQDVMEAVQSMRQRAYSAGTLRSTPQLAVNYDPGDIVIAPVSPNIVYVPYYNPWAVYGAPLPVYAGYYWGPPRGVVFAGGLALGFGVGLAIGAFGHFGWGFHSWAPNWRNHAVFYNHNTFISHSTTVINHGHFGGYNGHYSNFNRGGYNHGGFNQGGYNRGGYNQEGVNRGSYNHGAPAPGTSAARNANQQQRISNGVNSGRLNSQQTSNLEGREASIHNEKSNMRAANGGHLTAHDRRTVNHRQNHVSRSIKHDKHK